MKNLSQREIEKKIQEGHRNMVACIVPHPSKIKVVRPEQNHQNIFFGKDALLKYVGKNGDFDKDGFGEMQHFYISIKKYNDIISLFNEFNIPESIRQNLLWAFINMFFASCNALYKEQHDKQYWRGLDSYVEVISFLDEIIEKKRKLSEITLHTINGSKTFKTVLALELLEDVLKMYKESNNYKLVGKWAEVHRSSKRQNKSNGFKNQTKEAQAYYSSVILDYLRNNLFISAFRLIMNPNEYTFEVKRLHKLYSRRRMYLFIGRLMEHSRLLKLKDEIKDDLKNKDEIIIDEIKKKLASKLQAERRRQEEIKENNKNSKDGRIEVQFFDEMF